MGNKWSIDDSQLAILSWLCNANLVTITWFRSSVALEHDTSNVRVLGWNPSGITSVTGRNVNLLSKEY